MINPKVSLRRPPIATLAACGAMILGLACGNGATGADGGGMGSDARMTGPDAGSSLCTAPAGGDRTVLLAMMRSNRHMVYRVATDGSTERIWTVEAAGLAESYAWGDYDDDGDPDLAAAAADLPVRIFRNDGDTFALAWESPIPNNSTTWELATAVTWADYDGDDDVDLFVGSIEKNRLYRNDGGSFTEAWASGPLNTLTVGVAIGDYDGDGRADLAAGNGLGYRSSIVRGVGGNIFTELWSGPDGEYTRDMDSGDYDGDGDLDLLLGNFEQPTRVYANDGNGFFTEVWGSPLDDQTDEVAWADFDCDGDLDIAVANSNPANFGQENRLYEYRDGTYDLVWSSAEVDYSTAIDWGDYDGDGDPDLIVGNSSQPDRIYRNDNGVLTPVSTIEEPIGGTLAASWVIW